MRNAYTTWFDEKKAEKDKKDQNKAAMEQMDDAGLILASGASGGGSIRTYATPAAAAAAAAATNGQTSSRPSFRNGGTPPAHVLSASAALTKAIAAEASRSVMEKVQHKSVKEYDNPDVRVTKLARSNFDAQTKTAKTFDNIVFGVTLFCFWQLPRAAHTDLHARANY